MGSNIREFDLGLRKFADEIPENVARVHRAVALEGLRSVVRMTPVDTGRARANWQVSHGTPPAGEVAATDKSGSATVAKGAAVIATARPYTETFIANNLPYIERLEDGSSQQAPRGMLNVTFNRLRAWLARSRRV